MKCGKRPTELLQGPSKQQYGCNRVLLIFSLNFFLYIFVILFYLFFPINQAKVKQINLIALRKILLKELRVQFVACGNFLEGLLPAALDNGLIRQLLVSRLTILRGTYLLVTGIPLFMDLNPEQAKSVVQKR